MSQEAGYVYFLEAKGLGKFKIGKASVLPKRFNGVDTASPCELSVFGVIKNENYDSLEKQLHRQFYRRRMRKANGNFKEWFSLTRDELIPVIEKHKGIYTATSSDSEIEHKATAEFGILKRGWERLDSFIQLIFPVKVPHPNLVFLSTIVFAMLVTFMALLPLLDQSVYLAKGNTPFVILIWSFSFLAFSACNNRPLCITLLAYVYCLRWICFDAMFSTAFIKTGDKFIASIIAVSYFAFVPVGIYRATAAMSDWLGGLDRKDCK